MPHKGASTQCHNQQVLVKPRHQPSDRDQQAREKLKQKAKIKSRAYIQLGEEALQIVHKTFALDIPVILHLPAYWTIQQTQTHSSHCMLYKRASIVCQLLTISLQVLKPAPIVVTCPTACHNKSTKQQATTPDPVSQQTHPLQQAKPECIPQC